MDRAGCRNCSTLSRPRSCSSSGGRPRCSWRRKPGRERDAHARRHRRHWKFRWP